MCAEKLAKYNYEATVQGRPEMSAEELMAARDLYYPGWRWYEGSPATTEETRPYYAIPVPTARVAAFVLQIKPECVDVHVNIVQLTCPTHEAIGDRRF